MQAEESVCACERREKERERQRDVINHKTLDLMEVVQVWDCLLVLQEKGQLHTRAPHMGGQLVHSPQR